MLTTKLAVCQIYTWREIVKTWLKEGALNCTVGLENTLLIEGKQEQSALCCPVAEDC